MSSFGEVSGVSAPKLDVRPELDLAQLQLAQRLQFYNLQELRMITPIAYRDYGLRHVSAAVPVDRTQTATQVGAVSGNDGRPPPVVPRLSAPRDAGHSTTMIAKTEDAPPDGRHRITTETTQGASARPEPVVLPYGDDTQRIRHLVDWIVTGREVVPYALAMRQAGDLVPVDPRKAEAVVSPREVAAVYKVF